MIPGIEIDKKMKQTEVLTEYMYPIFTGIIYLLLKAEAVTFTEVKVFRHRGKKSNVMRESWCLHWGRS